MEKHVKTFLSPADSFTVSQNKKAIIVKTSFPMRNRDLFTTSSMRNFVDDTRDVW